LLLAAGGTDCLVRRAAPLVVGQGRQGRLVIRVDSQRPPQPLDAAAIFTDGQETSAHFGVQGRILRLRRQLFNEDLVNPVNVALKCEGLLTVAITFMTE
jgi:hypothetical protein